MRYRRYDLHVLCATILIIGFCANPLLVGACETQTHEGYFIMESSKARLENSQTCFEKEFQIIEARRKKHDTVKPLGEHIPHGLIGLGLSGGGIKSSSFQLGLLSGLHNATNRKGAVLLDEIDYIASVSGGSWANGAYIAAKEPDDVFFSCLDSIAEDGSYKEECKELESILPRKQSEIWGSKDWQDQIIDNYLRGNDLKMAQLRNQNSALENRPFPIFLSTHSNTMIGKKSVKNFPFEMTPLSIGAVADCNSLETPCGFFRRYLRPLHWNNPPEKGFVIDLEEAGDIDIEIRKYLPNPQRELTLSHAMWSSGGLVAKVFSLHLRLSRDGKKMEGIRGKYVLSDGGKTDNIGLIPLVERGVDLMILSQIASDAKLKFGDLDRSAMQVKRLFDANVDTSRLVEPHRSGADENPIITQSDIRRSGSKFASVWLIKPTQENVTAFYRFLEQSGKYRSILAFLEKTQKDTTQLKRFPQNDTIKLKYPQELMYAYYVLGKFIGEMKLSPMLNEWLDSIARKTLETPQ